MTAPNYYDPGDIVFGTRRIYDGEFRLQPTEERKQIVLYLALYWAQRYFIELHALVQMSNHLHYHFHDPLGLGSAFLTQFHAWVTRALNVLDVRDGFAWAPGKPSQPRCLNDATELEKLLYTAVNPTKAGIVKRSVLWKGVHFTPEHCGKEIRVKRPKALEKWKNFPESITYTVAKPRCYRHKTDEEVRVDFRRRRLRLEDAIAKKRGNRFTGIKAAMAIPLTFCTGRPEKKKPIRHFACNCEATLAAKKREIRDRNKKYRDARKCFRAGQRDIIWPRGTYAMHVWHGCPREGLPAG